MPSLTSDSWPTTSCIGWVQAGDVWALCVLYFCVCPKLADCSCVCRGLEACLHILPPILTLYGVSYFLISRFLWLAPFKSWTLLDCGFFLPSAYSFTLSIILLSFPAMPLCHSCCNVIWPKLTGPLWAYFLFFSQWLNMVIGFILMLFWASLLHCLWAPLSHLFLLRHPWPICFPWASLALFSNSVFPWAFTNFFGLH